MVISEVKRMFTKDLSSVTFLQKNTAPASAETIDMVEKHL
jgi:hypothetical protein